ncbi:MAG: hypothetical protein GX556_09275 [Fibrobacter sp.]|nr:hypothetical protein [Fibrobacter sp.]
MSVPKRFLSCLVLSAAAAFIIAGCGGASGDKLAEIENRIKALSDKGVPDSVLADVKVYLYNVTSAKKNSNAGNARKYTDSMLVAIVDAEKWYDKSMQEFKPYLENLRKNIVERKSALSGLQLKTADSVLSVADSFTNLNWIIQARWKMDKLDSIMPVLEQNEKTAQKLRKQLVGKWGDSHWIKPEEASYKALNKSIYKFTTDGKFEGSEEMNGQTTDYMKEDWQFLSWGTYDLKGDTIHLFISREKCPRQIFTQLNVKENKWIKNVKPTYDSTITNGSKDRFIMFDYLKENFKKM